jgi:prevent-host-death family protein
MCYGRRMAEVASRELRNNTRAVLDRVEAGEVVVITVDGRPIARLEPIGNRPRWMSKAEFVGHRRTSAADPGLTQDLRDLAPDTTDDLDLR